MNVGLLLVLPTPRGYGQEGSQQWGGTDTDSEHKQGMGTERSHGSQKHGREMERETKKESSSAAEPRMEQGHPARFLTGHACRALGPGCLISSKGLDLSVL